MTNHWIDIGNSDCVMIIGSNAAENHPISMRWVLAARDRGAKIISIDPRFTRTSAVADIYAPLRPGTDIAFIGGLINYTIQNELYNREYVAGYTNASFFPVSDFGFEDGLFSGYNPATRSYDTSSWQYQLDGDGVPKRDTTLGDPGCVFQITKQHYSRYDPATVSSVTGMPESDFLNVAETYCATGEPGKAGTIMYAMGATQHTHGTQNVRSYSILQLLLGNIGLAGGGINALRGESNVQGSTDHGLLETYLPGYLAAPVAADQSLQNYLKRVTPVSKDETSVNWLSNYPKYIVSLLKAWYGDAAGAANDFGFGWLPKKSADYSHLSMFDAMTRGEVKGLFAFGQNPAVGGPHGSAGRRALANLAWLVVADLFETETAAFWKDPQLGEADAKAIQTEVFLLPAADALEKEGSITNSGRWSQWRYKAADPVGESRTDAWIHAQLIARIKNRYAAEGGPLAEAIAALTWNFGEGPDPHAIAEEINGYDLASGNLLPGFAKLKDDGTTTSGNWLYSGSYTEEANMAARRSTEDKSGIGLYSEWAWSWPANRRIIYNRASVDPQGQPWDPLHPVIRWDDAAKKWVGDVPDGATPPGTVHPFIMKPSGFADIFSNGLKDGPLPEHYEPWESAVENALSATQCDPAFKVFAGDLGAKGASAEFPLVATTYRVTEHWQTGSMTRNMPSQVELMPEMFVEISSQLADERGIKPGEMLQISSARGTITARALVTKRLQPLRVNGSTIHVVGMPWHWGYQGLVTGAIANDLTPFVGDANTMIPEYKAFLVDVRRLA